MHIHVLMAEDSMGGADLLIRSDLGVSILLNCTSWCSWRMRGRESNQPPPHYSDLHPPILMHDASLLHPRCYLEANE